MRVLADTHLLLWAAIEPDRLSDRAQQVLTDLNNEVRFSAASIWEVAIKASLGRTDFTVDADELAVGLRQNGWVELPVTARHAAAVRQLPDLHRDPFDRILVAQARSEQLTLLTHDERVAQYSGPIEKV